MRYPLFSYGGTKNAGKEPPLPAKSNQINSVGDLLDAAKLAIYFELSQIIKHNFYSLSCKFRRYGYVIVEAGAVFIDAVAENIVYG